MGLSKKNKRKLVFEGRTFYWNALAEFSGEGDMLSVNIVSEDKKFIVKYFVVQASEDYKMQIIGTEFPRVEKRQSEISCPNFIPKEKKFVSPKDVVNILKWSFEKSE